MQVRINRSIQTSEIVRRDKGFTLIEALFVLSITFILALVILPLGNKWIQSNTEENAIASIVSTIHNLQSYSMAHHVYTRLGFQTSGTRTMYVASAPGVTEFSRNLLPEGMYISSSSSLKAVEFHANGDIIQSGVLTIVGKTGRTKITFQFQKGRMIISERERILLGRNHSNDYNTFRHFWYTPASRYKFTYSAAQKKTGDARC